MTQRGGGGEISTENTAFPQREWVLLCSMLEWDRLFYPKDGSTEQKTERIYTPFWFLVLVMYLADLN